MLDQDVPTPSIDVHDKQVAFEVQPLDVDIAADWMVANSKTGKRTVLLALLIRCFTIAVIACVLSWWSAFLAALAASLLIVATLAMGRGSFWNYAARPARKLMRKRLAPFARQSRVVGANKEALSVRRDRTESSIPWADIDACDITKDAIFISSRKNLAVFVPVRAFAAMDAAKRFHDLCGARVRAAHESDNAETASHMSTNVPANASENSAQNRPFPVLQYGQDHKRDRLGLLSLITGLISFGFICFGPLALVMGLAAISLGTISEFVAGSQRPQNRLGRWGIIFGTFSFLIGLIVVAVWGAAMVFVPTLIFRSVASFANSAVPLVEVTHKTSRTINAAAIAQACQAYSAGHDSHFPPHIAVLLVDKICTPEQIREPDSDNPPLPAAIPPHESDWSSISGAVDMSSDFIYTGTDITESANERRLADKLIVVYSKDTFDGTGRAIGFADGNARFVEIADMTKIIAECNTARAALRLPPMDVK